jgi:hypothetical protein
MGVWRRSDGIGNIRGSDAPTFGVSNELDDDIDLDHWNPMSFGKCESCDTESSGTVE